MERHANEFFFSLFNQLDSQHPNGNALQQILLDQTLFQAAQSGVKWRNGTWFLISEQDQARLTFLALRMREIMEQARIKITLDSRILLSKSTTATEAWEQEFVRSHSVQGREPFVICQDTIDRDKYGRWFFVSEVEIIKSSKYDFKIIIQVDNPTLAAQGLNRAFRNDTCRVSLWRFKSEVAEEEISDKLPCQECSARAAGNYVVVTITRVHLTACSFDFDKTANRSNGTFFLQLSSIDLPLPPDSKFECRTILITTPESQMFQILSRKRDVELENLTKEAVTALREKTDGELLFKLASL